MCNWGLTIDVILSNPIYCFAGAISSSQRGTIVRYSNKYFSHEDSQGAIKVSNLELLV